MAEVGRVDSKGRVAIPLALRQRLGIETGMVFVLHEEGGAIVLRPEPNPLAVLAAQAIEEYYAGQTISLRDYIAERDARLDGE